MRTPLNVMASQCIVCSTLEHPSDCVKPYTASGEDVEIVATPRRPVSTGEPRSSDEETRRRRRANEARNVGPPESTCMKAPAETTSGASDGGVRRKRRCSHADERSADVSKRVFASPFQER